jgi:hypothetical protein
MFTKADFENNEDNNYHTENGIEMAKHFGTKEEQELMAQIQKDHYARGHINPDEIEARNSIVKKYWHMLESVKEDEASDLYHDNVKSGKDYNDYKGIQIHNLRKELKRVRKILLNLQDIEGKDNSSDMVNDIRNMLGGYETMVDNMESAFDKLVIGRHRTESETTNEVADHGSTEYYRELDKGQLNHTRSMLMKSASQLKVAIDQRHKFSKELMGSGDRAGTGELYKMLDTLNELIEKWDDKTELYGT